MHKVFFLLIILFAATAAFSQQNEKASVAQSDAAKAFDKLKNLAGSWKGSIMNIPINFTIRSASSGTAILHEGTTEKGPPDHEITMFYVEGDKLLAIHFCDGGNRARFEGKLSPDGSSIVFTFLDVTGSTKGGLVKKMVFNFFDGNKHAVEFTFVMPDGKPIDLKGEFLRAK